MSGRFIYTCAVIAFTASFLLTGELMFSSNALSSEYRQLKQQYLAKKDQLREHRSGLPIYIESFDKDHVLCGDVYSIISHSFSKVKSSLIKPANWCDISLLHLNIKACTYCDHDNQKQLTIYSGRKFYQSPEAAFILQYKFQVIEKRSNYFKILLTADTGPLDTSDYRIILEAMPVNEHKTFIRFSYTYTYGLITQAAMEGYFATLGGNKVGFSIIRRDENNNPVYIDGTRGAIERNSVRYYLAFQAYLDTEKLPAKNRFEQRIHLWYSLTDQFHNQLFELPREEYLRNKKKEYQNQSKLQESLNHTCTPPIKKNLSNF